MARIHYITDDIDRFRRDDIRTGEVEPTDDDYEVIIESTKFDGQEPDAIYEALQGHTDTGWNEVHELRSMSIGDKIEFSDGREVVVTRMGFKELA